MVTVADLVTVEGLGLRVLGGPTDRALRWVATSELDDPTPFLEGGELLLTTGLRVPAGGQDGEGGNRAPGGGSWAAWVAGLARAGVSAVGFGVGLGHREVPAGLVAAGQAGGVGVLEVPPPTPFIAISRAVADLLQRGERAADTAALQTVRDLTREAGGSAAAPRVLRRLAAAVGGAAWLLDAGGAVRHAGPPGAAAPPEAAAAVRRMRTRGGLTASADSSGERTLLVLPVGVSGRAREFLVLSAPADLPSALRGTATTAVALLGLVADRERAERERDRRLLGCAVDLLCTGDPGAARQVLLADGAGATVPDRLRVLRADSGDHARAATAHGNAADASTVASTDEMDDTVLAALAAVPGVLASRAGGALVVVCADAPAPLRRVEDVLVRHGLHVGTGRPAPAAEAADSAASARAALRRTTRAAPVVRADDAHRAGLAAALGPEGVRSYARDVLAPLAALPPAEAERLADVGRAFLAHHGQRQPTADALGVHRNTVRQRIARLEQVLGRSMDSPADRADLWVALSAGADGTPAQSSSGSPA